LKLLFDMGCGFTEFLCQMFSYLSWSEVLCCRGVCRDWKEFVDEFVSHRHPAITDYHRWTEGSVDCSHLLCAGEVERLVSDEDYIYCAMQEGGTIMIFHADTFIFAKALEESPCHYWQLEGKDSSVPNTLPT